MLRSTRARAVRENLPTTCVQTCYWLVFVATIVCVQMALVAWSAEWMHGTTALVDDEALWSVAGARRPAAQPLSNLGPMNACLTRPDPFSPSSEYSVHDTYHHPGGPVFYVQPLSHTELPKAASQLRYREAKRYALELAQSYGGSAVMRDSPRTPYPVPSAFFDDAEETLLRLASCYAQHAAPSNVQHNSVFAASSWIWLDPSLPVAVVEDGQADLLSQHDRTWKQVNIARIGLDTSSRAATDAHSPSPASLHPHTLELVDGAIHAWLSRSQSTDSTPKINPDLRRRAVDTSDDTRQRKAQNLQDLVAADIMAQLRRMAEDTEQHDATASSNAASPQP